MRCRSTLESNYEALRLRRWDYLILVHKCRLIESIHINCKYSHMIWRLRQSPSPSTSTMDGSQGNIGKNKSSSEQQIKGTSSCISSNRSAINRNISKWNAVFYAVITYNFAHTTLLIALEIHSENYWISIIIMQSAKLSQRVRHDVLLLWCVTCSMYGAHGNKHKPFDVFQSSILIPSIEMFLCHFMCHSGSIKY